MEWKGCELRRVKGFEVVPGKLLLAAASSLVRCLPNSSNINQATSPHFTSRYQELRTHLRSDQSGMSLLRPSIAGRLLRAGVPSVRNATPATRRYDSHTALGTPFTTSASPAGSSIVKAEEAKEVQVRHNQPDYTAEVDQASS